MAGADVWELKLRTVGWIEGVQPFGFGPQDRYEVEGGGRRLVLRLRPRRGAPREVAFSVRPMGAPVWVEGSRGGRPLRVADIAIAKEGLPPRELPYRLPEIESEKARAWMAALRSSAVGIEASLPRGRRRGLESARRDDSRQWVSN